MDDKLDTAALEAAIEEWRKENADLRARIEEWRTGSANLRDIIVHLMWMIQIRSPAGRIRRTGRTCAMPAERSGVRLTFIRMALPPWEQRARLILGHPLI